MKEGRRSRVIEIMNFCESNHFTYNITWRFNHQYEIIFMVPEANREAVEAFFEQMKKDEQ